MTGPFRYALIPVPLVSKTQSYLLLSVRSGEHDFLSDPFEE